MCTGRLLLRMEPALHARLKQAAALAGVSLNTTGEVVRRWANGQPYWVRA